MVAGDHLTLALAVAGADGGIQPEVSCSTCDGSSPAERSESSHDRARVGDGRAARSTTPITGNEGDRMLGNVDLQPGVPGQGTTYETLQPQAR